MIDHLLLINVFNVLDGVTIWQSTTIFSLL